MEEAKDKGGRPSMFTMDLADMICARLADGESLRAICRDDDMPVTQTVFRWLRERPEFNDQYAIAREAQADAIFDEALDIADNGTNDWMEARCDDSEKAGWRVNGENIQRSRLRIDTRKWMAGKLRPKKYGEKVTAELSGPDGGPVDMRLSADPALAEIVARFGGAKQAG